MDRSDVPSLVSRSDQAPAGARLRRARTGAGSGDPPPRRAQRGDQLAQARGVSRSSARLSRHRRATACRRALDEGALAGTLAAERRQYEPADPTGAALVRDVGAGTADFRRLLAPVVARGRPRRRGLLVRRGHGSVTGLDRPRRRYPWRGDRAEPLAGRCLSALTRLELLRRACFPAAVKSPPRVCACCWSGERTLRDKEDPGKAGSPGRASSSKGRASASGRRPCAPSTISVSSSDRTGRRERTYAPRVSS